MMEECRGRHRVDEVQAIIPMDGSSMWVNKYAPRTYMELLSDDVSVVIERV